MRNVYKIWSEKAERKRSIGRPRCRWEIIIKIHLRKYDGKVRTGFIWLRIGTRDGLL
jgi:hypothetical protein